MAHSTTQLHPVERSHHIENVPVLGDEHRPLALTRLVGFP